MELDKTVFPFFAAFCSAAFALRHFVKALGDLVASGVGDFTSWSWFDEHHGR